MSNTETTPPEEPPERFRRLLDESEDTEAEVTSQVSGSSESESEEQGEPINRHPTGEPEKTGGWFGEWDDADDTVQVDQDSNQDDTEESVSYPSESTAPKKTSLNRSLPRRVSETDLDATRVASIAYQPSTAKEVSPHIIDGGIPVESETRRINWRGGIGCALRMIILALFISIPLVVCIGSIGLYQYYSIAKELPSVEDLRQRAAQFETTRILDRNGNILYEILDPQAGRRTYVPLKEISPYLVAATIATEDEDFYSHPGFDLVAIVRAFIQNLQGETTVSGASTITQQLARALLFSTEERISRSSQRKVNEVILATEITRRYSKDEILELYLNEIYYGNLAYGIEAAAQTYFGTSAEKLTLAQAAFLAGLPQAPSVYDVYTNREVTFRRTQDVLVLMYQTSMEQSCIYVSNQPQPVCVDASSAAVAANDLENMDFRSPDIEMRFPHWVNYVRSLLEDLFDPQTIYRSGFTVHTTLDPGLQEAAQAAVWDQVASLADKHASNGALVAVRPSTGEILAMVGSADFYNDAIDGQVNMAVSPRQPGSAIKPLTYTAAFEKGWTPATLIWDVPSEFPPSGDPNDPRPPYKPVNYDERFHGPVTIRSALANSYNVPAVKTLQYVGIYDNPVTTEEDGLIAMAKRLGVSTLTREDYGLSLTLGGGDVSLLELTGAYATFANGGRQVPLYAITWIEDHLGQKVYESVPPPGNQVIRSEHAFLITSILSDNEARTPAFGPNSVLNLPFPAVAKTGTTNDFRDNWTIGYTPDVVVGTWVGNADYTPMQNTSGLTGAAPIWASFIQTAVQQLTGNNPSPFVKPAGIVERVICAISGTEPSQWCPNQRSEFFAADQLPLPKGYDLWQKAHVDTWSGLLASPACSEFTEEKFSLNVSDPWAIRWIKESNQGKTWAEDMGFEAPIFFTPTEGCEEDDPHAILAFTSPVDGELITTNPVEVFGRADATAKFQQYFLEYGIGDDPVQWERLYKKKIPLSESDLIYSWDVIDIPAGVVTLRLYMISTDDKYAEKRIRIELRVPTPTPTPTNTPTPTPTVTPTPTPSITPSPTNTPSPTPTSRLPKATKTSKPIPSTTP
ncbi:MAG: transglycosylase domain-containing protein [Anaerolineales bacterium]|jgi:penicillin-binding protein 1C